MPAPMCSCGGVCVQVGGYVCFLVCVSTSAYVPVAVWAPGLGGGCVPGRLSRVRMGERQEEEKGLQGCRAVLGARLGPASLGAPS